MHNNSLFFQTQCGKPNDKQLPFGDGVSPWQLIGDFTLDWGWFLSSMKRQCWGFIFGFPTLATMGKFDPFPKSSKSHGFRRCFPEAWRTLTLVEELRPATFPSHDTNPWNIFFWTFGLYGPNGKYFFQQTQTAQTNPNTLGNGKCSLEMPSQEEMYTIK